jgi:hypothetical protein
LKAQFIPPISLMAAILSSSIATYTDLVTVKFINEARELGIACPT